MVASIFIFLYLDSQLDIIDATDDNNNIDDDDDVVTITL